MKTSKQIYVVLIAFLLCLSIIYYPKHEEVHLSEPNTDNGYEKVDLDCTVWYSLVLPEQACGTLTVVTPDDHKEYSLNIGKGTFFETADKTRQITVSYYDADVNHYEGLSFTWNAQEEYYEVDQT